MLKEVKRECDELERAFAEAEGGRTAPAPVTSPTSPAETLVDVRGDAPGRTAHRDEGAPCRRVGGAVVYCRDCEM
eukprot:2227508-Heterocapsa_arctica.AAC.1